MTLRRFAVLLVLLLVATLPAAPASAGPRPGTVVATDAGLVRGYASAQVRRFEGIPFARPPVGELRWRAPRAVRPWAGVRDATAPGSPCAQLPPAYGGEPSYEEDCLYLNVTTPPRSHRRLPVMVWLHGGSNLTGSGAAYDATKLAASGEVVVVTVNYRLGVFGWLAHPSFGPGAGNYGLLDQLAALRWVRHNAAAFGGDPRNVTLFGESAGAADSCALIAAPAARGLFHRAILQSYSCAAPARSPEAAGAEATAFATAVGCETAACLRAAPTSTLLERFQARAAQTGPVADTDLLPHPPATAIARGSFNRVPVIHGNTLDEMRLFVGLFHPRELTVAEYEAVIRATYGDLADEVLARYPASAYPTPRIALATVQSDGASPLGTCPHLDAYELFAEAGVPVYAYQFADRTAPPLIDVPDFDEGAEHAAELTYLWPYLLGPLTPAQERLSDTMVEYWTSFAHNGKPHARHAPRWPRFRSAEDTLSLDVGPNGIAPTDIAGRSDCAFWDLLS